MVGIVEVVRSAYPDHYAHEPKNNYFDPKSSKDAPRWMMVDVRFVKKLTVPLPLERLRTLAGLAKMVLLKKGSRLSVQPVDQTEWTVIMQLIAQDDGVSGSAGRT
ncbi:MAG: EVE domain-containing protein [Nitrospirales bacterium]|nr:EVE domain-containing protein [Nitrospirales bacterium]